MDLAGGGLWQLVAKHHRSPIGKERRRILESSWKDPHPSRILLNYTKDEMSKPTSYHSHYSNRSSSPPHSTTSSHNGFSLRTVRDKLTDANTNLRIHVLIPLGAILNDAMKNYPKLTSYILVLAGLSVIPIIAFVGFSLFISSILIGMGLMFVVSWGSAIIGFAFFLLVISLAFLVAAALWIVLGLFMTIFVLRLMHNLQNTFVHKIKHSQVIRELVNHSNEKQRLQQQNGVVSED